MLQSALLLLLLLLLLLAATSGEEEKHCVAAQSRYLRHDRLKQSRKDDTLHNELRRERLDACETCALNEREGGNKCEPFTGKP